MKIIQLFLEFVSDKDLSIPVGQGILLVLLNSICLLFGRHRLGLLISYCFVFYWGFVFNKDYFVNILGDTNWGLYVYGLSGFTMIIVTLFGFFQEDR